MTSRPIGARCDICPLRGRVVVPGHGYRNRPDIAFVAEAPGDTEQRVRLPLVGRAGQFLRRVLKDLGIDESRCYFTNTCLCKPAGEGKPKADAVLACSQRLADELSAIRPKLVVTLGGLASTHFLQFKTGITRCHGVYRVLEFRNGFTVGALPTYHPSGVLRTPSYFIDFVEELHRAKRILDGAPPVVEPPYKKYKHIYSQVDFERFLQRISKVSYASLDIETDMMNIFDGKILCIGFSWKRGTAHIIDWQNLVKRPGNTRKLNQAISGVKFCMQNGMFDSPFLDQAGIKADYSYDTMFAHFLLDERKRTHGLEKLAVRYYWAPDYKTQFRASMGVRGFLADDGFSKRIRATPKRRLFNYCGADADYTFRLAQKFDREMSPALRRVLFKIMMPSAKLLMEMAVVGIKVDEKYRRTLTKRWEAIINEEKRKMQECKGAAKLNFNSPQQMSHYLYDVLNLRPFGVNPHKKGVTRIPEDIIVARIKASTDAEAIDYWRTNRSAIYEGAHVQKGKRGLPPRTTSTYTLYDLRSQHPFPGHLIAYRVARKKYSMYTKGLSKYLWPDGRVRPIYDMCAAETGRCSSSKPPMHNLPAGDEIYNIYIADPGWVILHADEQKAEMCMMAHLSQDKNLIKILKTKDIHTEVAKRIYHLTDKDVAKLEKQDLKKKRVSAKMVTFGIPYGRSPGNLAPQLAISTKEAIEYMTEWFAMFPELHDYIEERRAKGIREQESKSIFGRVRRFPLIPDRRYQGDVGRQAFNMGIQSPINDLTLWALIQIVRKLRARGIPVKVWPHIHDSLNICVPKGYVKVAIRVMVKTMKKVPFKTNIQFKPEIEAGTRWGAMKTVYE